MSEPLWRPMEDFSGLEEHVRSWLAQHMSEDMPWLLVHADDGVIWGRRQSDGSLLLSSDVFDLKSRYPAIAVELQPETLQQVRIFGPAGELLIWRNEGRFQGRSIIDGDDFQREDAWQEQHLLWGTSIEQRQGFSLLKEGQQGPQHAIPIAVSGAQRAALTVRHYAQSDQHGQAMVGLSRLVNLGLFATTEES
jgi:CRISPR-associated protein (TIGR03984 family)